MTDSRTSERWGALRSFDESDRINIIDGVGVARDVHLYVGGLGKHRPGGTGKPQGFMVRMPPDDEIRPHFHRIDQFQVFFGATGGRYLRTPVEAGHVLVQYADAYSTYGPLSSGAAGMDFFTLRAFGDDLSAFMPGSRRLLVHKGRRLLHADMPVPAPVELAPGAVAVETLIGPYEDQLACFHYRVGAGGAITGPDPSTSSGQFYCVIGGTVRCSGSLFGAKSMAWVGPEAEPLTLRGCGENDFEVLVLQYPSPPSYPPPGI